MRLAALLMLTAMTLAAQETIPERRSESVVGGVSKKRTGREGASPNVEKHAVPERRSESVVRGVSKKFIGTWELVSYRMTVPDGDAIYPMGEHPLGRITYTPGGRMSAQLSAPDRGRPATDDRTRQPESEQAAAYRSFVAYFGEYEIREKESVVVHHVKASLNPAWVGTAQLRRYRFERDRRLVLEAETNFQGRQRTATLVWTRLE